MVGALTMLMLVLWIVLDLLIYFANVFEGETCASPTFIGWFFYRSVTAAKALEITIYFLPILPLFYLIYALRHFSDIRNEYRRHMKKVIPWHSFRWVQRTWFALRSFFVSQWSVRSPNTHCIASDTRTPGLLSRAHILGPFLFAYRLATCAGQGRSRYGSSTWISTTISFSPAFTNRSPMNHELTMILSVSAR